MPTRGEGPPGVCLRPRVSGGFGAVWRGASLASLAVSALFRAGRPGREAVRENSLPP